MTQKYHATPAAQILVRLKYATEALEKAKAENARLQIIEHALSISSGEGYVKASELDVPSIISLLNLIECKCDTASFGGYTCPRCETIARLTVLQKGAR